MAGYGYAQMQPMHHAPPPSLQRMRNTELTYPIVVGTIAFMLGRKTPAQATHRWTAFVRGINDEDLSPLISKVVFNLHESFAQPQRVLVAPPFEVTEEGWGEFEMHIQIHFHPDCGDGPLDMYHFLRLYEDGEQQGMPLNANKKPVLNEVVEELVFVEPAEGFYRRIMSTQQQPVRGSVLAGHVGRPAMDGQELAAINEVRQRVSQQVAAIKNAAALEAHAAQQAAAAAAAAAHAAAQGVIQHGHPMAM